MKKLIVSILFVVFLIIAPATVLAQPACMHAPSGCPYPPSHGGRSPIPSPSRTYRDTTALCFMDAYDKFTVAQGRLMSRREVKVNYGNCNVATTRYYEEHK